MGEGEGGMIWEKGIKTCILLYVKRIASPGSMHEGWDGGGGGKGVRDEEHMYTHGWFMSMYGKNHYNTVKELASNKINKLKSGEYRHPFSVPSLRKKTCLSLLHVMLAVGFHRCSL